MNMAEHKTEVVVFNSKRRANSETPITTQSSCEFLGYTLQNDLSPELHLQKVIKKVRQAAGRINALQSLAVSQKKHLYYAWAASRIRNHAPTYLPFLSEAQMSGLQVAAHNAVRAILSYKSAY